MTVNYNNYKYLVPAAGVAWEMASSQRRTTKRRKSSRKPKPTKTGGGKLLSAASNVANYLGIGVPTRTRPRRRRRVRVNFKKVNVKNDTDKSTRTYYTQKVTKQQARKIRRRFRNGSSPFQSNYTTTFVDTIPQQTNSVKWIWRTETDGSLLSRAWNNFILPSRELGEDTVIQTSANNFAVNQEQQIYFSKFKYKYEIYNPTNYDMHVVIYDIVCKADTDGYSQTISYNYQDNGIPELSSKTEDNPIALMNKGTRPVLNAADYIEAGPGLSMGKYGIFDINMNPTYSYPFNIHFKIVGKKTITLQPGATMFHTFIHKPRCLMSRGYYMYKYQNEMRNDSRVAVENFTSGSLFKVWGQLAANTSTKVADPLDEDPIIIQDNSHGVTNLSGRIAIKCHFKGYWHCMAPKARFIENRIGILDDWFPEDEEALDVVNSEEIKHVDDEHWSNNVVD